MKHKTWFRLVLKAIGIFLLATGVAGLLNSISTAYAQAQFRGGLGMGVSYDLLQLLNIALFGGLVDSWQEAPI